MIAEKLIISLFSFLQVKGDCLTGNCEKISLDVNRDARLETEFVGHIFLQFCHVKPSSVLHLVHTRLPMFVIQLQGKERHQILRVK